MQNRDAAPQHLPVHRTATEKRRSVSSSHNRKDRYHRSKHSALSDHRGRGPAAQLSRSATGLPLFRSLRQTARLPLCPPRQAQSLPERAQRPPAQAQQTLGQVLPPLFSPRHQQQLPSHCFRVSMTLLYLRSRSGQSQEAS